MSIEATYTGYIETTQDTLLIFEACRRALLPRICRRLQEKERKIVSSGSVFVFDERESGIKRWTDGLVWSPSRILGNFLVYRELDKRSSSGKKDTLSVERQRSNGNDMESQAEKNKERALVGSLTNSYRFKKDGLIKKTMSITVNGVAQHMISYYTKEDVLRGSLKTPSQTPQLATLEISQEFLLRQNFRIPPVIEGYGEGAEPTSPNSVISHSSISTSSSPVMSMTNGCTCSHHPTINNAGSVSPQQQQQPSRMIDFNTSNRIKMEMESSESVYRPPNFTSSYTATPSSGFTSSYTYPPVNNTIADITNPTLPLPSTTNVRGFVAPHSHRQSFSNEFPPVTTASAHMTNPSSRILTSSPPLMPGHHLSNPATVTAAASDYSQYYSPHVSNTTSPTTTATASTWNDYQGFSYSSSTHSNSNGSSNQPLQSHQSHHGGHNESSNDVFYASTTGNPNSDTTTMYGGGGAGNSYNDLPPSTLPELYNSSSSQSHHHHNQTGGPHSSSSPSPTMPPSPPILNHHHHHHHSSSNGSTSSSGSSSSNITPITPPLSSATTNDTTIISGAPISSVFTSPTTTLNYSSQFTAAATAAYVKGETGYATASPHSAAAAASLAGPNSGMYADAYLPWMA